MFTFKEFADNYDEITRINQKVQDLDREIDSYDISLSEMQQERHELSHSPLVYPEDVDKMVSEVVEKSEKKAEKLFDQKSMLEGRIKELIHSDDDVKIGKITGLHESILTGKTIESYGNSAVLSNQDVFENWNMVEKAQDFDFRFSIVEKYNKHWLEDGSQEVAEEFFKEMDPVSEIQSLTKDFEDEVIKETGIGEQQNEDLGDALKGDTEAGLDLWDDLDFDDFDDLEIDDD